MIENRAHQAGNVNVANVLTVLRLACVPLLGWLMYLGSQGSTGARDFAAVVFLAASLTDLLDGALARRRGLETPLGALLDPIADKALIGVALIGLSWMGDLWWWVTIVILARELIITGMRLNIARDVVISASRGGKVKTLLQTVAITMYLAIVPIPGWELASQVMMAAALIVTVVTGLDYFRQIRSVQRGLSGGP